MRYMEASARLRCLRRVASVVVAVTVSVAGCGRDADKTTSSTTVRESPTSTQVKPAATTDPTAELEDAVATAYDRWRGALRTLLEEPDPESALLDELYVEGPARDQIRDRLADAKAKGLTSPPRPDDVSQWAPLDVTVESRTEAVVVDCFVDGGWTIGPRGEVLDEAVYTYSSSIRFVNGEDGTWRAASVDRLSMEIGRVGCAEQLPSL